MKYLNKPWPLAAVFMTLLAGFSGCRPNQTQPNDRQLLQTTVAQAAEKTFSAFEGANTKALVNEAAQLYRQSYEQTVVILTATDHDPNMKKMASEVLTRLVAFETNAQTTVLLNRRSDPQEMYSVVTYETLVDEALALNPANPDALYLKLYYTAAKLLNKNFEAARYIDLSGIKADAQKRGELDEAYISKVIETLKLKPHFPELYSSLLVLKAGGYLNQKYTTRIIESIKPFFPDTEACNLESFYVQSIHNYSPALGTFSTGYPYRNSMTINALSGEEGKVIEISFREINPSPDRFRLKSANTGI